MKKLLKDLIKKIPIAFTQNQKYDRDTKLVIFKVCSKDSACIDVGCHKGEILELFLKAAPEGKHFAFEPIPELFAALQLKYGDRASVFPYALSDKAGKTTFNFVVSNPSYSGIQKRKYDREGEQDIQIEVDMERLDAVIPTDTKIALIKIDVEGGEFEVLKGADTLIRNSRPVIIFEHGLGGSDFYGTTPKEVLDFFAKREYEVSTMARWLKGLSGFALEDFEKQYFQKINYYFIAYPKNI